MKITDKNWAQIQKFWGSTTQVTASPNMPYCVFATTDENGLPRIAPYSTLILGDNNKGFYFDEFSGKLSKNIDRNPKVSVLLLKNSKWFWIKTVLFGKFDHAPAIRLTGIVGKKRSATSHEINRLKKPLSPLKFFKGYHPLWGVMKEGRDVYFESFEPVRCGAIPYMEAI